MIRALLLLCCLWPALLYAAAGKLDSFEGEVKIASKTGDKAVKTGLEVDEGDVVRTGANAWALFEMSDGATITVRPSTELRITTYRYAPDAAASQNSSVLDLAKGALRVVTGLIGQNNRAGYAVKTPTATIGIRGTDHEPAYYETGTPGEDHQSGTYDKVNEGETVISDARGRQIPVQRGRIAFVPRDGRLAPRLIQREPGFYRLHAEIDRRAAARRTELRQKLEQRQQQLQERREDLKDRAQQKPARDDLQDRREAMEERREQQEQRPQRLDQQNSAHDAQLRKQQELREHRQRELQKRKRDSAPDR